MLPLFTTPLALFGLLALPVLAGIYLLHTRSRPYPVSSLLLWADAFVSPEGGRRVEQLRLPLLFWLELFALLLLVLAAAGPHVPTKTGGLPLVVVLDDSSSMLAGELDSPRNRAAAALLDELRRMPRSSVRLVLAGDRPQVLGDGSYRDTEVKKWLDGWTCQASTSRLDSAVGFALELGGDLATILVLTDHPPQTPPTGTGRLRWWAFGTSRPNGAFVYASRTPGPRGDRLLLEIANLAKDPRSTVFRVETGQPPRDLRTSELRLKANETHRVVLELPEGDAAPATVRASIGNDDLPYDNSVSLVRAVHKPVRYDVRLSDQVLKDSLERALRATRTARLGESRPDLVFLDGDTPAPEGEETWVVRIVTEPEAEAFTGPFVLDRSHPLTDGLSLTGAVWGGGKTPLQGAPVVMAGNVALLTDTELASGRHELRLRLRSDQSTLTESPAWPALIWNLVQWRAAHLPGLDRANVRLGEEATWTLANAAETVEVTKPNGEVVQVPVRGRRVVIRADRPGVFTLRAGSETAELGVNPLSRDESDLTGCATGRWGDEYDETTLRLEYRDMTWLLVLLAAGVITLHLWLAARASTSARSRVAGERS